MGALRCAVGSGLPNSRARAAFTCIASTFVGNARIPWKPGPCGIKYVKLTAPFLCQHSRRHKQQIRLESCTLLVCATCARSSTMNLVITYPSVSVLCGDQAPRSLLSLFSDLRWPSSYGSVLAFPLLNSSWISLILVSTWPIILRLVPKSVADRCPSSSRADVQHQSSAETASSANTQPPKPVPGLDSYAQSQKSCRPRVIQCIVVPVCC